jgi:hypothetical protein
MACCVLSPMLYRLLFLHHILLSVSPLFIFVTLVGVMCKAPMSVLFTCAYMQYLVSVVGLSMADSY